MRKKQWYKLDNVGKFYSSLADSQFQNVFRYSATIKDEINKDILQEAVKDTLEIYKNFQVNLKKGLFWYYLEETNRKYKVQEEKLPICSKIYHNSNDFLFRVTYYNNRINFEVSHILSDGRGSVEFFKTLISNYIIKRYQLKNISITTNNSYIEKSEDSFSKYYKKVPNNEKIVNNIYRYKEKKLKNTTRYMEAHMDVSKVLEIAHEHHVTLTVLIISVLIYSFREVLYEKDLHKNIKIEIPVDLRKYYKSTSSKNYFGLTSVVYQYHSREDSLSDILKEVDEQLKNNLILENLQRRVNKLVAFEKNILCRVSPLFMKNIVLNIIDIFSRRMRTSCVSNIGVIKLDEKILPYVKDINVLCSTTDFQFILCSYEKDLSIGISSVYKYNDVIKEFCRWFKNNGIEVTINVSEVE